MEAMTKVLAALYEEPEKPLNALQFVAESLGWSQEGKPTVDALRAELEDLVGENLRLRQENDNLRTTVSFSTKHQTSSPSKWLVFFS